MAISENTIKVLNYLKNTNEVLVTANDVADALGLTGRQVNGIFTGGIQRKGLGIRVDGEVLLEDGGHKAVKFLKLTDAGLDFIPEVETEA